VFMPCALSFLFGKGTGMGRGGISQAPANLFSTDSVVVDSLEGTPVPFLLGLLVTLRNRRNHIKILVSATDSSALDLVS
jgi:hypothetical protein